MPNPYYTKPGLNSYTQNGTSPTWAGTPQHQPKTLLSGGGHLNADAFPASSDATTITVSAAAAAGATSVSVSALTTAIPSGAILKFAAGKFAQLTDVADSGDATLTVEALPAALTAGNVAYYSPSDRKYIQSGTIVGRTWAERDANLGYGPADVATDNEIHILYFDVHNSNVDNEAELYQANSGNVVYENFLPGWETLPDATKAWVRSNYVCITAQP